VWCPFAGCLLWVAVIPRWLCMRLVFCLLLVASSVWALSTRFYAVLNRAAAYTRCVFISVMAYLSALSSAWVSVVGLLCGSRPGSLRPLQGALRACTYVWGALSLLSWLCLRLSRGCAALSAWRRSLGVPRRFLLWMPPAILGLPSPSRMGGFPTLGSS